jgi:hypothetical protein
MTMTAKTDYSNVQAFENDQGRTRIDSLAVGSGLDAEAGL